MKITIERIIMKTTYRSYDVVEVSTGTTHSKLLSHAELLELIESGEYTYHIDEIRDAPATISGRPPRPDSGFREVLSKIKHNNIRSKINTF